MAHSQSTQTLFGCCRSVLAEGQAGRLLMQPSWLTSDMVARFLLRRRRRGRPSPLGPARDRLTPGRPLDPHGCRQRGSRRSVHWTGTGRPEFLGSSRCRSPPGNASGDHRRSTARIWKMTHHHGRRRDPMPSCRMQSARTRLRTVGDSLLRCRLESSRPSPASGVRNARAAVIACHHRSGIASPRKIVFLSRYR